MNSNSLRNDIFEYRIDYYKNKLILKKLSNKILENNILENKIAKRRYKYKNKLKKLNDLDILINNSIVNDIKLILYNILNNYKIKSVKRENNVNIITFLTGYKILEIDFYNVVLDDLKNLLTKDYYIYIYLNNIIKCKKYKIKKIFYKLNKNLLDILQLTDLFDLFYDYDSDIYNKKNKLLHFIIHNDCIKKSYTLLNINV